MHDAHAHILELTSIVFRIITVTACVPALEQAYPVRAGETLAGIAAAHGISTYELMAANPSIHDPNADWLVFSCLRVFALIIARDCV